MTERIKDAPELRAGASDPTVVTNPVFIVHVTGGVTQFLIFPQEADPALNDPRPFGILISDLIDHIARCYHDATGKDERLLREGIMRVVRDENKFKDADPGRGNSRGTTIMTKN